MTHLGMASPLNATSTFSAKSNFRWGQHSGRSGSAEEPQGHTALPWSPPRKGSPGFQKEACLPVKPLVIPGYQTGIPEWPQQLLPSVW